MQDSLETVADLYNHVQSRIALPPAKQCLVISEDRVRQQGFSKTVRRATTHISNARQDVRSAVINAMNFVFLPEAFNRWMLRLT